MSFRNRIKNDSKCVIKQNVIVICAFFSQVQQANVDDEEIARAINSKLGETPGISYSEIASKAVDCGRTQLAIKVGVVVNDQSNNFFFFVLFFSFCCCSHKG